MSNCDRQARERELIGDNAESSAVERKRVLPYLRPEVIGDGGAFPDIHVAQYPLGMGLGDEKSMPKILPRTVLPQGHAEKIVNVWLRRYKGSNPSGVINPEAVERIIRVLEMPEPPKFKRKRVPPKPSGSPPVPLMPSPPRPFTVKGHPDWKIPPSTSNWKMLPKSFKIALDKLLAADGRGLQDGQINEILVSLYLKEQSAREFKELEELMLKERERMVQELPSLAQKARSERTGVAPAPAAAPVPVDDIDMQVETDMFIKPEDEAFTGARKKQSGSERMLMLEELMLKERERNVEELCLLAQKARSVLLLEKLALKERERKVEEFCPLAQKARSERTCATPVLVDDIDMQVETDRFIKPDDEAFTGARKKQSGSERVLMLKERERKVEELCPLAQKARLLLLLEKLTLKERERKVEELCPLAQKARSERTCTTPVLVDDIDMQVETDRFIKPDDEAFTGARRKQSGSERELMLEELMLKERERKVEELCPLAQKARLLLLLEKLTVKERERKVEELCPLAQKARSERTCATPVLVDDIDMQVETDRFIKPDDEAFTGARKKQSGSSSERERPVEFDNAEEEGDTFGLDHFMTEVKRTTRGKNLEDHVGKWFQLPT